MSLGHAGEPPEFEQRGCGRVFLVSDQLPEQGAGLPGVVCLGEHRGRRLPLCGEESALASTRTPSRPPPSPLGGPHGRHTAGLSSTPAPGGDCLVQMEKDTWQTAGPRQDSQHRERGRRKGNACLPSMACSSRGQS